MLSHLPAKLSVKPGISKERLASLLFQVWLVPRPATGGIRIPCAVVRRGMPR